MPLLAGKHGASFMIFSILRVLLIIVCLKYYAQLELSGIMMCFVMLYEVFMCFMMLYDEIPDSAVGSRDVIVYRVCVCVEKPVRIMRVIKQTCFSRHIMGLYDIFFVSIII